jgi:hypothetical protein
VFGVGAFLFGPKELDPNQPMGTPGKVSKQNVATATIAGGAIGALVGYYTRTDLWVRLTPRP